LIFKGIYELLRLLSFHVESAFIYNRRLKRVPRIEFGHDWNAWGTARIAPAATEQTENVHQLANYDGLRCDSFVSTGSTISFTSRGCKTYAIRRVRFELDRF
jgi:hypothetical protein